MLWDAHEFRVVAIIVLVMLLLVAVLLFERGARRRRLLRYLHLHQSSKYFKTTTEGLRAAAAERMDKKATELRRMLFEIEEGLSSKEINLTVADLVTHEGSDADYLKESSMMLELVSLQKNVVCDNSLSSKIDQFLEMTEDWLWAHDVGMTVLGKQKVKAASFKQLAPW